MSFVIHLELPHEIEERLRQGSSNLAADVKEAYAVELYRRGQINRVELSAILGLDRHDTDAWLLRHNVFEGSLTMADLDADQVALDQILNKAR